jgi:hypothetical protein
MRIRPTRPRRALALGTGLLLLAPTLAACGSSTDEGSVPDATETLSAPDDDAATGIDLDLEAGSTGLGIPDVLADLTLADDAAAGIAWTEEPGLLYVITFGSSTCPVVAEPQATGDADGVTVSFVPLADDVACTADYVPTTTVVGLPDSIGEDVDLAVTLEGIGSATVPARSVAGTEVLVPVTAAG